MKKKIKIQFQQVKEEKCFCDFDFSACGLCAVIISSRCVAFVSAVAQKVY